MLGRSLDSTPQIIRILLPEGEPLILHTPPSTLAELLELIATKARVQAQDVRLTFRDAQGARMMLVGEKRYREALNVLNSRVLQMTVVLMPDSSRAPESPVPLVHSRSISDISHSDCLAANQKLVTEHTQGLPLDPKLELHKRITSMLHNSMHYFSSKFKDMLYELSACEPAEVKQIDLREARIGRYECILLSEVIELLPELHSLNLECNTINNGGLATLCQALQRHKAIRRLNLSENDISAKGLKVLAGHIKTLARLELLAVARNRFNREDIEGLLDAAPAGCTVHHDSNWSCSLMPASSEDRRPHKVPLIADMQQIVVPRSHRAATVGGSSDPHSTENPETASTEATPLGSPRNVLKGIMKELKREAPDPETLDQLFCIRNLMTGEELDLRDENDESFPQRFAGLVDRERFSRAIEEY